MARKKARTGTSGVDSASAARVGGAGSSAQAKHWFGTGTAVVAGVAVLVLAWLLVGRQLGHNGSTDHTHPQAPAHAPPPHGRGSKKPKRPSDSKPKMTKAQIMAAVGKLVQEADALQSRGDNQGAAARYPVLVVVITVR